MLKSTEQYFLALGSTPGQDLSLICIYFLSLSSRDLPQKMSGPQTRAFPALPRSGPARSWAFHTPTASSPTSGWCRRWRRVPRQREPYKMATAARASARPGAFSRASSRTRECALPASPPPPRSGATNPAAAHNCPPPVRGRGHVVTALRERRSARPQPRLANHCCGRGSRLARPKGSGSNHCLGKTVRPGGFSKHHNGSWYQSHCRRG